MQLIVQRIERSGLLQILILVVLGFVFYWPSLLGGPTFIDDNGFIFESLPMTKSTSPLIFWDRTTNYARSWPLSYTVFWTIFQFAKTNYWVYKLVNLFLHILNACLLISAFKKIISKRVLILSAIAFLIHPVQVETVSWIFQLKTILATTFFLLSFKLFLVFLEKKNIFIYISTFYLFLFSLLSKITAIMLPFVFLLHTLRSNSFKKYVSWLVVLPFFVLSLYVGLESTKGVSRIDVDKRTALEINKETLVTVKAEEKTLDISEPSKETIEKDYDSSNVEGDILRVELLQELGKIGVYIKESPSKIKIAFSSFSHYLFHFVFPIELSIVHSDITKVNLKNFTSWLLASAVFLLLIFNLFFFKVNINKELYLSSFYILAIIPILGFVFIPFMNFSLVADHWMYFGMLPLCILFMHLLERLRKDYSIAIISTFIIFWSYQALTYVHTFNHRYEVIERAIEMVPNDFRFHMELGTTLLNDNKLVEAQLVFETALANPVLESNMTLLLQGAFIDRQLGDKEKLIEKIVKLGRIYFQRGDTKNGDLMVKQLKENSSNQDLINLMKANK